MAGSPSDHRPHVPLEPEALPPDLSPLAVAAIDKAHHQRRTPEHHELIDAHGRENALAAAVRDLLPSSVADKCRIQVIVRMQPDTHEEDDEEAEPAAVK